MNMALNPPLILVSALFFLALTSALYLASWLLATLALRVGRSRSYPATKRILITALVMPPILAALPTWGGATLRHSHAEAAIGHHSAACRQVFVRLFAAESAGTGGMASEVSGMVINGLAWALMLIGFFLVLRLARTTTQLEAGLMPYLHAPSPKLSESLSRMAFHMPGLPTNRFFECGIPAAYSGVVGLRRVRCILSRDFVTEASAEELDAVVAHEAGHLLSHDLAGFFLVAALNRLFFPLRPVRLLTRRWREAAELACDDQAVAATRQPLAMAAAILRASGSPVPMSGNGPAVPPLRSLPGVVMPFTDEAACSPGKRVERLLDQARQAVHPPARESALQVWSAWAATLIFGGLGIALLLSPEMICYAHCSLEAVARLLP